MTRDNNDNNENRTLTRGRNISNFEMQLQKMVSSISTI